MPAEIKWNNRFNIGVDSIDKAHQKLFQLSVNWLPSTKTQQNSSMRAEKALNILRVIQSNILQMKKHICSQSIMPDTLCIKVSMTICVTKRFPLSRMN